MDPTHRLSQGLVGCWLMNEQSGILCRDSSLYGNHGTMKGFGVPANSRSINGISFDGVNDYVDLRNTASLNITNAITIGAWVNRLGTNIGSTLQYTTAKGVNETYMVFMAADGSSISFNLFAGGLISGTSATYNFADSAWHHIVATYNGANQSLFIDGNIKANTAKTGNISTTTTPVSIGGRTTDNLRNFNGSIDEVRIYNRALSAGEIKELYVNPYSMFRSA